MVVYACADFGFGPLVNLNVSSLDFADNGTTLSVFGTFCGPSAAMTGSSASDGSFNVCCTYAGTCAETYCLSGTFTDEDNWSGTFTAAYSGSCFDCTSQERTTSGTRRGSSSL